MTLTRIGRLCALSCLALLPLTGAFAQQLEATPEMMKHVAELFGPEDHLTGPVDLQFKADIRMHAMGFEMRHFDAVSGGKVVGRVIHVKSVAPEPPASQVEYMVRFDDQGRAKRIVPLTAWEANGQKVDTKPLFYGLEGQAPDQLQSAMILLINSLVIAEQTRTVEAPKRPPAGTTLDLQQKILEPGAKLPVLKLTDIDGKTLSTAELGGKPLVLVFCGAHGKGNPAMISALEEIATWRRLKDQFHLVYVIAGSVEQVKAFRDAAKLSGQAVADQQSQLSKLLQIPFKPYALMCDKDGVLRYNAYWTDKKKLGGSVYMLVVGKAPENLEDIQPVP